ncbi:ABC transporter permease [Salarchaeum sp. JOR-1]|uniref:ABC transporter permease n=1 Tax=Salarchaeum sp. JOR-1 TaxID=2599399 RepID=UPI00119851BF|nr:ABC transporter permease [Salarchaeum sp. JOR-1]
MRWYVTRRVLWAVVATVIILTITFGLMYLTPNPQTAQIKWRAAQQGANVSQAVDAYNAYRGNVGGIWQQYIEFMGNMVTLDWGWSDTRSQPVIQAIAQAYPYSLAYGAPSIIISTVLGIAIGLYSATHRYSLTDYFGTFFGFFGLSIPNFWFGIILLLVFSVQLGWTPVVFNADAPFLSLEMAHQLILPVITLTTSTIAGEMRYSRAEAMEYVHAEFVKTARAKGVDEMRVLTRHILRPALVPLMTILVADMLGVILTSSYLVEIVFGIPGLGRLSYDAITQQDTALVLGTTMIPVFIAIVGNLLQDIAYTIVDPRIDFGDR